MKTAAAILLFALLAVPFALAAQQSAATTRHSDSTAQCAACHGANGEGNPAMNAPRLAGQNAPYLARQLEAYANGERNNAVMGPIAKGLSREAREAAAQHYADLHAPTAAARSPAPARGRELALVGDDKLRLQACANCHGPDGIGEPPVPYLAGQQQKYLAAALAEWKSGARRSDPSGQMPHIGAQLNDADIHALSQYFASLTPPAPRQLVSRGPANAGTSGVPSGPAGTTAPRGVGIEQGSPTTGGSQGAGGEGGGNTQNEPGGNGTQSPRQGSR
jgi:cytochrome c553